VQYSHLFHLRQGQGYSVSPGGVETVYVLRFLDNGRDAMSNRAGWPDVGEGILLTDAGEEEFSSLMQERIPNRTDSFSCPESE